MDSIIIAALARTPQGNLLGELKDFSAPALGSAVIRALLTKASLLPRDISEVILGCVLPAGLGQAPARQAALGAGLPDSTPCVTINKMCGSGMQAVIFAHDLLLARATPDILIAGGMESMTNAPYLLPKARQGYRLGHGQLLDHLFYDGLEDAYEKGRPMGYFAEHTADQYQLTRAMQDEFATLSLERAQHAIREKLFAEEITPLTIKTRQGEKIIDTDEHPLSVDIKKIPLLSPVFKTDGTITAANSSSISDGAAALLLMRHATAKQHDIQPIARVVGYSTYAKAPCDFPTAPIHAMRKLLTKINWSIDSVDLFEINEAFAVVPLAAMQELHIPHEKMNVRGGGCALGHPIGATGARIIVTLIHALRHQQAKRGIAALCIGGGEATALAVEMI